MQHHRKGLRAARATLGGIQRKLSSSPAVVASCVSLLGCRNATQLVPLSPSAVRDGAREVERRGTGHIVDGDGDSHEVSGDTLLYLKGSPAIGIANLITACRHLDPAVPCLLDDPAVAWQLPMPHRVAETWGALAVTTALILANYKCFGPGCGDGGEVAIGITDGLVVLTVGLAALFENFGVSSSCGPLAPPCMPREELT